MKISTILDHIDSGHMALPEIQRGYVWNRDQVRGLRYLDQRNGPMNEQERDKLLFRFVRAGMRERCSGSTETVIDQDLDDPGLWKIKSFRDFLEARKRSLQKK